LKPQEAGGLGNLRITYDKQDEQYRKNFVKISITVKQFSSWANFIAMIGIVNVYGAEWLSRKCCCCKDTVITVINSY